MLIGEVNDDLQAWIPVEILARNSQLHTFDFVLDTGFTGQLALPVASIRQLELPLAPPRIGYLADGTEARFTAYTATALWDGQHRIVEVLEAGDEPLLGMELLQGSRVTFDVRDGGPVTIAPLP